MIKILRLLLVIFAALYFSGCGTLGKSVNKNGNKSAAPSSQDLTYKRTGDIVYAIVDGFELKLDIYTPLNTAGKTPCVIWFHGGGFTTGSKISGLPAAKILTPHGFTVVSIEYRLAPKYKMIDIIHDCKGAIRWVKVNADKYNIDVERIGVWGDSAGGHLASYTGLTGGVKVAEYGAVKLDIEGKTGGNNQFDSKVKAICDYYGLAFFAISNTDADNINAEKSFVYSVIGGDKSNIFDNVTIFSPLYQVSADDPHILIVHGEKDSVVPILQSEMLYDKVRDVYKGNGKIVDFMVIQGAGHAGKGFWDGDCANRVVEFFKKAL